MSQILLKIFSHSLGEKKAKPNLEGSKLPQLPSHIKIDMK